MILGPRPLSPLSNPDLCLPSATPIILELIELYAPHHHHHYPGTQNAALTIPSLAQGRMCLRGLSLQQNPGSGSLTTSPPSGR